MMQAYTEKVKSHFNSIAASRDTWREKNNYYYQQIENLCKFVIPEHKQVIELGCGTGDLLASLHPQYGVGVDIAENMISIAKKKHPNITFIAQDIQKLQIQHVFDYVVISDTIGNLQDIQIVFEQLHKIANEKTRIIATHHNYLWEPLLTLGEKIGLKMPQPVTNWLSSSDIENLLFLADLEVVKKGHIILVPIYIPLLSKLINKYVAKLPIIKHFCLTQYYIIRKKPNLYSDKEYSVSVIIPARNEKGSIEQAVTRTPNIGKHTELIFVEKGSSDGTYNEIKRIANLYATKKDITYMKGKIDSKGEKVRQGFAAAKGDILMILDSDLTVAPEDLPKFYQAIRTRKGDFIMGTRLVYPMEKQAMRLLNVFGNKFFSALFSWLLDQPIKDTLCGTKVIFKDDYEELVRNRTYFGDFDPFGDFDLIFGAAKLNLKIVEIPVRYYARFYGKTNIHRFRHGLLLLRMTLFATKKIKFI